MQLWCLHSNIEHLGQRQIEGKSQSLQTPQVGESGKKQLNVIWPSPSSFQGCEVACPIKSCLVLAQEEQRMVQDTDTRNLVMVPIVCASFSQLGITGLQ